MKSIALLLFISTVTASAIEWSDLHVKWNSWILDILRWNSFFAMPLTVSDAVSDGNWVKVEGINSLNLTTYCYEDDAQVCLLYDNYENFAGFQGSYMTSDVQESSRVYNPSDFNVIKNKTIFGWPHSKSKLVRMGSSICSQADNSHGSRLSDRLG